MTVLSRLRKNGEEARLEERGDSKGTGFEKVHLHFERDYRDCRFVTEMT